LISRLERLEGDLDFQLCDVTSLKSVTDAIEFAADLHGQIDFVINNAGIERADKLNSFDEQQWEEILDVNLNGAIRVTRAALHHLAKPGGVIINIASALGLGGCQGYSVYSASKAGMIGFTQSLAWELGPDLIRVVGVAPAMVHTPMVYQHLHQLTPEISRRIEDCHPLGMGSPHDVANAVAFLASDEARWITGVTLPMGWAPWFPIPVEHVMTPEKEEANTKANWPK
jgi:3-oxoacyl-[acyl-carrier protein] reductase